MPARGAGFRDRGTLVEGSPADIVICDFAKLLVLPQEVAHDLPGDEWRRVQPQGPSWSVLDVAVANCEVSVARRQVIFCIQLTVHLFVIDYIEDPGPPVLERLRLSTERSPADTLHFLANRWQSAGGRVRLNYLLIRLHAQYGLGLIVVSASPEVLRTRILKCA